jgi:flagellar biosynthesis protein FlhF
MQLQTFKAPTMAEALAQVKREMGTSAVILHTRSYWRRYCLGLRRREIVEITAGKGLNVDRRRQAPGSVTPRAQAHAHMTHSQIAAYGPVTTPIQAAKNLSESHVGNTAAVLGLTQEMTSLKSMVKDLVNQVRLQHTPQVPEELFEHYQHLIQSQVAEELAIDIVKNIQKQCRPEHLLQKDYVNEQIAYQLEKLIPVSGEIVRKKTAGPHVVALIGPTGVGKTTTIAKLAANLKLREKRKIGLITIDTYRIAAIDQLKKYADIIGSPLRIVGNPEDLRDAVASMSDCDFILIDTAGRSPNDTLKLHELKNFLAAAAPDEVHLVLSTTASQACVELAIERFGEVRIDKIIFTKLDEAAHVGVVLNVVRKVNKALSYVTTGQDVPRDIEVGHGRKLAQMILRGGVKNDLPPN